LNFIQDGF